MRNEAFRPPMAAAPPAAMVTQALDHSRRRDLFRFTWGAFEVLHGAATPFLPNWHVEAICYELGRVVDCENRNLLVTLPPRHLKTICTSIALPAFLLGRNPDAKIIIVTYSADLSNDIFVKLKQLMSSDYYRRLFPNVRYRASGPDLKVAGYAGAVRVTSVGGSITGFGGDYIIMDDLMKAADAESETERENVREYIRGTLLSRLNNKATGCLIAVQQRLHEDDAAAFLKSFGTFHHLNLPAVAVERETIRIGKNKVHHREVGEILFPQNESRETLAVYRNIMSPRVFETQYQQNPIPDGGGMLDWGIFKTYDHEVTRNMFRQVVQSWDTAWSEELEADFSVCTTWGHREEGWYLLDLFRGQLSYNALKRRILFEHQRWRPDKILIERAGSGVSLLTELRREEKLPGSMLVPMRPVNNKEVRFAAAVSRITDGNFYLPAAAPWLAELRKECLQFPGGRHDDQVDSVSQFLTYLGERRVAVLMRNGQRPPGKIGILRDRPRRR